MQAKSQVKQNIVARAFIKTYNVNHIMPMFRKTKKYGIEVITSKEMFNNKQDIIALGGAVVRKDHRNKKLSEALTYARLKHIMHMKSLGYAGDAVYVTNVGLWETKAPDDKSYHDKLYKKLSDKFKDEITQNNMRNLIGKGEALTKKELDLIFKTLKLPYDQNLINKNHVPPLLGAPRIDTLGSYLTGEKLCNGDTLATIGGLKYKSPIPFKQSDVIKPDHGGRSIISFI